jgi:uncharacterized protein YjbI with pentapeptide repeats
VILAIAVIISFGIPSRRPFNLFRANLSDQWLVNIHLEFANLSIANLSGANLRDADLRNANLRNANLRDADLSGANLSGANLSFANLSGANLSDANRLIQLQLDAACGDAKTRLPPGLSVKFCRQN